MSDTYQNWEDLVRKDILPADAENQLRQLVGSGWLEALNPRGPSKPNLQIRVEPKEFVDHCLYKSPDGERRTSHKFIKMPAWFLQDRAERIAWVQPALAEPSAVFQRPNDRQELLYYRMFSNSEAIVCVISKPSNLISELKTFWVVSPGQETKRWKASTSKLNLTYRRSEV